eukprot:TRINITY_DN11707_c0_g1_i1.p1 TRINITY_DN11707_c0_g1~~TRINITY_DN11707_c0_g1_i1.p1  ORF type:complete len:177 (-),score=4.21 TRINITY_DN11707_c0_g1_i1:257-787(-)
MRKRSQSPRRVENRIARAREITDGRPSDRVMTGLLIFMCIGFTLNGLWMLFFPKHWYENLPAALEETGPFNWHFVRDIGSTYVTVALAAGWAAVNPLYRAPLIAIACAFNVLHAFVHLFEVVFGHSGSHRLMLDFPAVYLVALVNIGMLVVVIVRSRREKAEQDGYESVPMHELGQ